MSPENMRFIAETRKLRQADLARAAGVSRQAVSRWMNPVGDGAFSIRSRHLHSLAKNLDIDIHQFFEPLPDTRPYATALLWDRLYPNLPAFLVACVEGEKRALARMVQVYGLLITVKLFGQKAMGSFSEYKKYIHPVRRKESEQVWKVLQDPI